MKKNTRDDAARTKSVAQTMGISVRRYKQMKREDAARLVRIVKDMRWGCVGLPGNEYERFIEIAEHVEELRRAISQKNWGR